MTAIDELEAQLHELANHPHAPENHCVLAKKLSGSAIACGNAGQIVLSEGHPRHGEPFVPYSVKRVRSAVLNEVSKNDILTRRRREVVRFPTADNRLLPSAPERRD